MSNNRIICYPQEKNIHTMRIKSYKMKWDGGHTERKKERKEKTIEWKKIKKTYTETKK